MLSINTSKNIDANYFADDEEKTKAMRIISLLSGKIADVGSDDDDDYYDSEYGSSSDSSSESDDSDDSIEEDPDEMMNMLKSLMTDDMELIKAECDAQWNYKYLELKGVTNEMARRIEELTQQCGEWKKLSSTRGQEIIELSKNVEELAKSYRVLLYILLNNLAY